MGVEGVEGGGSYPVTSSCVLCTVYCVLCTVYCVLCTVYCVHTVYVLCTAYFVLCQLIAPFPFLDARTPHAPSSHPPPSHFPPFTSSFPTSYSLPTSRSLSTFRSPPPPLSPWQDGEHSNGRNGNV